MSRVQYLIALSVVVFVVVYNLPHARATPKPRPFQSQLSAGAVSINLDTINVREKRQDYYGRNPPSPSRVPAPQGYEDEPSPPQQRQPQPFNTQQTQFQPVSVVPPVYAPSFRPHRPRPVLSNQPFSPAPSTRNQIANRPAPPRAGNRQPPPRPASDAGIAEHKATRYYYPPRMPLPLPECFHNPTGYVCCNQHLNDLMVDTYTDLENNPKFTTCNINAIASQLQKAAEKRFNVTFETIAGFADFAQQIHFNGNLACKIEIGGKYMLAYGTVKNAEQFLPPDDVVGPQQQRPLNHLSRRHTMRL